MTPREKECVDCSNDRCQCRDCRGAEDKRAHCGCRFSEDSKCSWQTWQRLRKPDEEDIT